MRKQNGSALVAVLGVFGVFAAVVGVLVMMYISANNMAVAREANLDAAYTNNTNILGQYTLKIQEAAAIPAMYKDDLKEVLTAEFAGRYGKDGSKATFQWIQERANNYDSSIYVKLQQLVEAGRNEFQVAQTRMIDEKRAYVTELGSIPTGFFMKLAGFPKADLNKYKPVVAGDTAAAFETGVQAPVKMR